MPRLWIIVTGVVCFAPPLLGTLWWKAGRNLEAQTAATVKRNTETLSLARLLNFAVLEYSVTHNHRLPEAKHWEDTLRPYIRDLKQKGDFAAIPTPPGCRPRRFALNAVVAGKSLEKVSGSAVLFFESNAPGPHAADPLVSLPQDASDHLHSITISYVGGYTYTYPWEWVQASQIPYHHKILLGQE